MSLSNSVKTVLQDPVSHNNSRSVFKLDDGYYASSLRLVDVGLEDANANGKGFIYPTINGCLQMIKNIFLYSDTVLIDSIQNIPQYSAIEALKTSNQGAHLNRQLIQNGLGFDLLQVDSASSRAGCLTLGEDESFRFNNINGSGTQNNQVPIGKDQDQQSGAITLSSLLKFLETVSVLPMIPNLRLVIEYDTTVTNYFNDPANAITAPALNVIRPTLVVEQLLDMGDQPPEALEIPYMSTIVERFAVPATASPSNNTVPQRSSFKSQAFTAKFVRDLTFFNLPSSDLAAADRYLTRLTRSAAQKGEVLQVVLNNRNHLPDVGIDSAAKKFMYFNDAQRPLNLPLIAALEDVRDASGNILEDDALEGQFSVTSVKVGERVNDLRLEYQRLYGSQASSQEAFTLVVFGTVARQMSMKGGQVRIAY
jgi:hypothetical protein